jgi:acyl carrier protein
MSIQDALSLYIRTELAASAPDVGPDTDLTDVIDSTAVMELVVHIEDTYGFQVELDDITPEHFGTINRLTAFIEARKTK